jgi:membrane protein CcdC involved in cytochrome C biogenesis
MKMHKQFCREEHNSGLYKELSFSHAILTNRMGSILKIPTYYLVMDLIALIANASNYTNPLAVPQLSGSSGVIVLVIIAVFLTVRVYRNMRGLRFSSLRLYYLPIIYTALTLFTLYYLAPTVYYIGAVFIAIVIGIFAGLKLATGVKFFDKDNQVYYRRAPTIMVIWMVSFIARLGVELFLPTNLIINLAIELILAGTTGLIIGEAIHISRSYKKYVSSEKKENPKLAPKQ